MATTTANAAVTNDEENQETAPVGTGQADTQENEPGTSSDELDEIPEKFVNKSPMEIIRSYKELEKHAGKVGSEKAAAESQLESERQRRLQLEAELQNRMSIKPQTTPQQSEDYDPSSVLEKHWNDSPKEAIKAAIGSVVNTVGSAFQQQRQQAQQSATASRWEEIKRQNPDEAKELEPIMVQLSSKLGRIVRPDQMQSPEVLDSLYDLARAQTIDKRIEAGVQRKLQTKAAQTTEKRNAFTESNSTQGDNTRPVEGMSRAELRKLIGVSEKY